MNENEAAEPVESKTSMPAHPWVEAARDGVRFGVVAAVRDPFESFAQLVRRYEEIGFDSLWLADHPVVGADPFLAIAAVARETARIRLGVMVACVAYRNPVVLARLAADVDRMSNGRLILGLGSGDLPPEFAALGLEYGSPATRRQRLEETLAVVPPLLRGEGIDFDGQAVRAHVRALPLRAAQSPRVPILVAGGGRQTLRVVADHADACNLGAVSWAGGVYKLEQFHERLATLREWCERRGRDYGSILKTALVIPVIAASRRDAERQIEMIPPERRPFLGDLFVPGSPEEVAEALNGMIRAGIQYLVILNTSPETAERFAQDVRPLLDKHAPSQ